MRPALPLVSALVLATHAAATEVSFNRDILPVLSDKCFHCHGFDKETREADLRLDLREDAVRDGAIVPGKSAESEMIVRIFSTARKEMMPPPKSHLQLSAAEKDLLKRWIDQGAIYEPHWAFVTPPKTIVPPIPSDLKWPVNEIDKFVLARLNAENLKPSPEASPERWLRRVTFDLTGLPPTQAEIDGFLADSSNISYESVVDRLLASPRFGEHMATPWLDTARYADSFGYQSDVDMHAWPYRDWVIRKLNENLPWDQFITEQLAGDLLENPTRDQKLATAFNRLHRKTNEGGSIPEEMLQDGISDRVHTVGTAFLGLTFECSRCHDHKYDPILAKDYYSLASFFNSIDEFGVLQHSGNRNVTLPQPALLLPTPEQEQALDLKMAEIKRIEQLADSLREAQDKDFQTWLAGNREAASPDLVAHLSLDEQNPGALANSVDSKKPGKSSGATWVPGNRGQAVRCNGDDSISIPDFGIKHCHDAATFSLWIKPVENHSRAVILANTTSADANYCGYELLWENGRLRWTWMREFPGNAISVETSEVLSVGQWTHIAVTYDGSSKASGLRVFLNGKASATTVVRDNLTRDFKTSGTIHFGARIRDLGLRGGSIDEIRIFKRAIAPLEALELFDEHSLTDLTKKKNPSDEEVHRLREYYLSAIHPPSREMVATLLAARRSWRETMDGVREIAVMKELKEPKPTFVLQRGAYDQPGEKVDRETPVFLPPFPKDAPRNRLGYAEWLTMPDHPLTSRVLANRIWMNFFGRGIVATPDNFGLQGARPTHPELLDWLARDFMNHGWDLKRACRQIVLSATYRQDSKTTAALREKDPDNTLLARGPSRRLTAEMLRDSALALGGLLKPTFGGPPVHPYQPDGSMWKTLNNFLPEYQVDQADGIHRRSLYTFWRRTTTPPNMMIFDATTRDTCAASRQSTNTPLQPLVLLNDPQFVEAARALGERMLTEGGSTDESRTAWAFREVSGRTSNPEEKEILVQLYQEQRERFTQNPGDAARLLKVGQLKANPIHPPVEAATAATVASALLNLDASIMLR